MRRLQLADRVALTEFARTHRAAAHRLGTGQRRTGTSRDPAPTDDIALRRHGRAAARCLPAGLGIGRGCHHRRGSRCDYPRKGRIAELFAGCGTHHLRTGATARVAAWEGDRGLGLRPARRGQHAGLAGRIKVTQRDLARQPLQAKELAGFAAVVLDPPFAGAAAQVAQIAAANVPVVIYVSCNPATLSRDAQDCCARRAIA